MANRDLLFLDTEARGPLKIKQVGTYKHAATSECIIVTYAFGTGPVEAWFPLREETPEDLALGLQDPDQLIVAHHCAYDRTVLRHSLLIDIPIPRWRDSMAKAYSLGLPGALADLGRAIGLPQDKRKLADGKKLVSKFCTPRRPSRKNPDRYWEPETKPAEWARFVEYAKQDVKAMRAAWYYMPDWNYRGFELGLWILDQRINERGLPIDKAAIQAVIDAVEARVAELNAEVSELTGGRLTSATQRDALLTWLAEQGVVTDSIAKAYVRELLEHGTLSPAARRVLEIRQEIGKTSTAKYRAMLAAEINGTLKGMFQWNGAFRTGRWAGRLVQLQNLPQGDFKGAKVLQPVEAFQLGIADALYADIMKVAASCIRPMITAAPGKRLGVSDLANIEGRIVAWLAGEQWKLDAFAAYDRGEGPDLYKLTYARGFGVDVEAVDKKGRTIGKVQELAMGYEGGVGAFITMAAIYAFDPADAFEIVWAQASSDQRASAVASLQRDRDLGKFPELGDEAYLAADLLKQVWRRLHPRIVMLWRNAIRAAKSAVVHPGKVFKAGRLKFLKQRDWLLMILPSGRAVCYYKPRIKNRVLRFWGMQQLDNGQRVWTEIATYGGKIVENATQATARDILAYNMPHIEAAAFELLGSVHDEVITQFSLPRPGAVSDLNALLARPVGWADGLPLAAEGYESHRYWKD